VKQHTKVIIDTNVLVSGIFFSGPPARILKAWQDGRFQIILSEEILDEYRRVIQTLSAKLGHIDFEPILETLLIESELVPSCAFDSPICEDPDDDKFLACAMVSHANYLVTGDNHLLKIGLFLDTRIVTPRHFIDNLL
jgi:putative PIN family toxin of toxin-antitoxin system